VPCSALVPSGPAYPDVSSQNQVCPVNGAIAGSHFVSGDRYIEASFEYTHAHLWRNYAILLAFFFSLMIVYGLAVEFVPQVVKGRGDVLIFLKQQKTPIGQNRRPKQEKQEVASPQDSASEAGQIANLTRTPTKLEISKEAFTWDKIQYQIPVKGGSKTLLTDIDGFVKPGTMTGKLIPYSPHTPHSQ
jgi:ATP-binding cassette subfamily G (WHITE) protein 2 (PDR)